MRRTDKGALVFVECRGRILMCEHLSEQHFDDLRKAIKEASECPSPLPVAEGALERYPITEKKAYDTRYWVDVLRPPGRPDPEGCVP